MKEPSIAISLQARKSRVRHAHVEVLVARNAVDQKEKAGKEKCWAMVDMTSKQEEAPANNV